MSVFTTILNLIKPDSVADANQTFNLKTFLNDNWDKLDTFAAKTITTDKLVNNLAATQTGFGLDATQGKAIQDEINVINSSLSGKISQSSVINNLSTTSSGYVLDARQGKTLNDNVTAISNRLTNTVLSRPPLSISANTNLVTTDILICSYTIPVDGKLFLNAQACISVTTADTYTLNVKLNGTIFSYGISAKPVGRQMINVSGFVGVSAGNVITVTMNSLTNNSAYVYPDAGLTHLDIFLLSNS